MLELNDVTLVSVTSIRVNEAIWALKHSSKNIRFQSVKLLTDADVSVLGIEVIPIDKLDYDGYSRFVVFELYKYFDTGFVLLIQDDGYVVNPNVWTNEFLAYDYIGAPWPLPLDDFTYRDHAGKIRRVGNGGFSLRSRNLCRLAADLGLPWEKYHGFYHEDGFICTKNVHIYEEYGCQFAPVQLAVRFSQEEDIPECRGVKPFGFHGKRSKYNIQYNRLSTKIKLLIRKVRKESGGRNHDLRLFSIF